MNATATHITEDNVEYALFVNAAGKFAIRVYDLDAEETVTVKTFPNETHARTDFAELVAKS